MDGILRFLQNYDPIYIGFGLYALWRIVKHFRAGGNGVAISRGTEREHGKVVSLFGTGAGTQFHSTGNADLDALENDVGPVTDSPTSSTGPQGFDQAAVWTRLLLIGLLVAGLIKGAATAFADPAVGPWAVINMFTEIDALLFTALLVVWARHGRGTAFLHSAPRLLVHEISGLFALISRDAERLARHERRREAVLAVAETARVAHAEAKKQAEFEKLMNKRMQAGRAILEDAMGDILHYTKKEKVPKKEEFVKPDGTKGKRTVWVDQEVRHTRARVEAKLVAPNVAMYHLRWLEGYDPQVAAQWERVAANAASHLRYAIGSLVPEDAVFDESNARLTVILAAAPKAETPPTPEPEIEDEPGEAPLDLETPLGIGTPPLSVLNQPNRHAIGRTNEGRTASQAALAAIKKMGMEDAEIREVKSGPVVSTSIIHLPSAQAGDIKGIEANLRFSIGQKNLRAFQAEGYQSSIAVEWPNASRATVSLREVCSSPEVRNAKGDLVGVLGVTATGQPIPTDVAAWPNGLVGGQPGAGKSGFENALLVSLLLRYSPAELRILPIDPKKVELRPYRNLPHLLCPPIIQPSLAGPAFSWAVGEMERRYDLMEQMGVKKLADLNKRLPADQRLPRILILADEAQMVMENEGSEKEIKSSGTALATMSRASGVHLLFATQKPVVDVVPTVIKGCLTTRVALSTATAKESEVILDQGGAESLLGKGDLLARIGEGSTLVRAQSPWVADEEVDAVVAWWSEHAEQVYDPGLMAALGQPVARPRVTASDEGDKVADEVASTSEDGNWFDGDGDDGLGHIRRIVDGLLGNDEDDPKEGEDDA